MKKFNYQSYGSHAGRMNNGGDKFRRIALFPLMLLMLLLLPTRMVAQTANGNTSNQAYAEFEKSTGTFTFKCGPKPAGAYDLNEGETCQGGMRKEIRSRRWSSMLRLPMQDPRAVIVGSVTAII